MAELEHSTRDRRDTPQYRALVSIAVLHRLCPEGDTKGQSLVEGLEQASFLIAADMRAGRQYEALVRLFSEAQATDTEWCARRVAEAAEGTPPADVARPLEDEAARLRHGSTEAQDREWPRQMLAPWSGCHCGPGFPTAGYLLGEEQRP